MSERRWRDKAEECSRALAQAEKDTKDMSDDMARTTKVRWWGCCSCCCCCISTTHASRIVQQSVLAGLLLRLVCGLHIPSCTWPWLPSITYRHQHGLVGMRHAACGAQRLPSSGTHYAG
jgi:hypothetical protein